MRGQILESKVENFMTYADKSELQVADPGLNHIPQNSPVVELDIINPHGGPAMRLIFAVEGPTYKLFCLMQ